MASNPNRLGQQTEHHEKKGITDQIKEKLPGDHHDQSAQGMGTGHDAGGYGGEKKGITDKITEKLPGNHHDQSAQSQGMGMGTATGTGHEKKGMMDNIKEKLPGGGGH